MGKELKLEAYVGSVIKASSRAHLIKIPTPVLIKRQAGGEVSGVLAARRACDFLGWLKGGRAVYLECKSTAASGRRWRLDKRLREYQIMWLMRAASMGCVAGVMVRHQDGFAMRDYLIPVTREGLPFEGVSVLWGDIRPYIIPPSRSFLDAMITRDGVSLWDRYLDQGWSGVP